MQVQAINTVNYTSTTKEITSKNGVESSSDIKFDMTKPINIESFTFEDYKNIDGKELYNWIKNSSLENEDDVHSKANALWSMAHHSDDNILNEVLFDKLDNSLGHGGTYSDFIGNVLVPLMDMASPIDFETLEEIANDTTKMEKYMDNGVRVFDAEDVLSNMKSFPEYYSGLTTKSKELFADVTHTYQAFDEIITEYTKRKEEENATLEAYTRNTKQSLFES